jgi:hypothetical protein
MKEDVTKIFNKFLIPNFKEVIDMFLVSTVLDEITIIFNLKINKGDKLSNMFGEAKLLLKMLGCYDLEVRFVNWEDPTIVAIKGKY